MDYNRFLSAVGRQLQDSAIRRMGTVVATRRGLVSFAPGYPDATMFPWDDLRAIAAERPLLKDRVVFITGGAFTDTTRSFLGSIGNRTLKKPVSRKELHAAIAQAIR